MWCTYTQVFLCRENLAEKLASTDAEGVTEKAHFLDIIRTKLGDVRLEVFSSVKLQTLPLEGENLARG